MIEYLVPLNNIFLNNIANGTILSLSFDNFRVLVSPMFDLSHKRYLLFSSKNFLNSRVKILGSPFSLQSLES